MSALDDHLARFGFSQERAAGEYAGAGPQGDTQRRCLRADVPPREIESGRSQWYRCTRSLGHVGPHIAHRRLSPVAKPWTDRPTFTVGVDTLERRRLRVQVVWIWWGVPKDFFDLLEQHP